MPCDAFTLCFGWSLSHPPTETALQSPWLRTGEKGEKGEKGDAPVKGGVVLAVRQCHLSCSYAIISRHIERLTSLI